MGVYHANRIEPRELPLHVDSDVQLVDPADKY